VRSLFPLFGAVNLIEAEQVPAEVTRYHFTDPAGARNMFMVWVAVDEHGRHFVYREWPDVESLGEWALEPEDDSHLWDGKPGPAQPTLGYGVTRYKRLIWELEGATSVAATAAHSAGAAGRIEVLAHGHQGRGRQESLREWDFSGAEVIEKRYMDPRSGKDQRIADDEGGSSLIDRMKEEQTERETGIFMPGMDFEPAPGLAEDEGFQAINDLLSYNKDEPLTALVNEPRLYVVRSCKNFIWAMQNYTGRDGKKGACKDPIDLARYFATRKLEYYPPGALQVTGGFG
jgi:hypothetical protein